MEMEIDWYEGRERCLRVDLVIEQAKLFTDCRRALSQCDNSVEGKIGLYRFRVDCLQLGSCTSDEAVPRIAFRNSLEQARSGGWWMTAKPEGTREEASFP